MNSKALIAEFIGTFALIFIGVGAIATNYIIKGETEVDLVAIALAHGLTIAVMVSATAAISGGHLNPAVTFGAWLAGKINLKDGLGYIIVQCLGAIFAASLITSAGRRKYLSSFWAMPNQDKPCNWGSLRLSPTFFGTTVVSTRVLYLFHLKS
ncbi:aquaporin [Coleofasciculus sp. F4-SAH-05]|uniref:aquaporin n=1 Tax=Coleofasciculus sp. F4-SAH-05 TaxID=3069525 RepID=UPI0032F4CB8D